MGIVRRKLPRLERGCYRGRGAVHWTLSLEHRATGWLNPAFHAHFREILVHACVRHEVVSPVYCLMPDHLHLMTWGMSDHADSYLAMRFLRKHTSDALLPARYQKQAYDHVLHDEETGKPEFEAASYYVMENPVRVKLCADARHYPFSGSVVPGYPSLRIHDPLFWDLFWRICCSL